MDFLLRDARLENISWFITDDFGERLGWYGVSDGEIWIGEVAWGIYWALWKPNTDVPLYLLLSPMNENLESSMTVGFGVEQKNPANIWLATPPELPWDDDCFGNTPVSAEEFSYYGKAIEVKQLIPLILGQDASLSKYMTGNPEKIFEVFSSKTDEFGYFNPNLV